MFRKSEAPAAERNKGPILEILKTIIKIPSERSATFPSIKILEISSGTGQHISHFAKHLPSSIFWQPSEYETRDFSSICAYIQDYKLKNVAPPVFIDIRQHFSNWNPVRGTVECNAIELKPIDKFEKESLDYIYNSNLMHISSFECTEGLFLNSGELLKKNGCLITYGPYGQNGVLTPESNVRFDAGLRASDPTWGVRDIQFQLIPVAKQNKLNLLEIIDMPANNKILIWIKE